MFAIAVSMPAKEFFGLLFCSRAAGSAELQMPLKEGLCLYIRALHAEGSHSMAVLSILITAGSVAGDQS